MKSSTGKQTIAIYMFPNISRSKGKQTIKFGQLIEYNMKYYTKNVVKTLIVPDTFLKNKFELISGFTV